MRWFSLKTEQAELEIAEKYMGSEFFEFLVESGR
jgi:hypothetical protein